MRIDGDFFSRDVLEVAPALLGSRIVIDGCGDGPASFEIRETEAYRGEDDLACHASRGRTPRTSIMYNQGGVLYVYLIYGMHWMLNIVTGQEGDPQAVLIRSVMHSPAAAVDPGNDQQARNNLINGPGRLTRALGVDGSFNGENLYSSGRIWLEKGPANLPFETTPRIGIDYAGEPWRSKPWRFVVPFS